LYEDAHAFADGNVLKMISDFGGGNDVVSVDSLKNLLVWYAVEVIAADFKETEVEELVQRANGELD
jgi:hypothetical protein